jgi:hypothetical protein
LPVSYTGFVARGWESKSIEEQISEHEAEIQNSSKKKPSPREIEQRSKREGILLARSRTASALESARDERYRALLQRTLDHLDSELAKLE